MRQPKEKQTSLSVTKGQIGGFLHGFYGYGNLKSPYWFISRDERGGRTADEVMARMLAWNKLGKKPLVDMKKFYHEADALLGSPGYLTKWFRPPFRLHRTWKEMSRIILAQEEESFKENPATASEKIRDFQLRHFGASSGNHCLLHLLPVPTKGAKIWPYASYFDHPLFEYRSHYMTELAPGRISWLADQVQLHKPKYVIFFGKERTSRDYWNSISGATSWSATQHRTISDWTFLSWPKGKNATKFLICDNPQKAVPNGYFEWISTAM
jgi:hypothetical protein